MAQMYYRVDRDQLRQCGPFIDVINESTAPLRCHLREGVAENQELEDQNREMNSLRHQLQAVVADNRELKERAMELEAKVRRLRKKLKEREEDDDWLQVPERERKNTKRTTTVQESEESEGSDLEAPTVCQRSRGASSER